MADVPADTALPEVAEELAFVLRLALEATGLDAPDGAARAAAERAVDAHPGDPREAFPRRAAHAAAELGLVVEASELATRAAAAAVSPRCPLFTWASDGPVAFVDRRGSQTRVRRVEGEATWVRDDALGDAVERWVSLEVGLAWQPEQPDAPDEPHTPRTPRARLRELLWTEREDLAVLLAYALLVGLLSLAVPVATQVLVNTVAFGTLLQPIVVLSVLLVAALGLTAVVQLLSLLVVEQLQRRTFVRVVADLVHRLPRVRQDALDRVDGPELVNRFFDVLTVQKSLASLLLDGITLLVSAAVGLALLAVYHPVFLGFDLLLVGLVLAVLFGLGRGAERTAIEESKAKYATASWIEELARHPLAFKAAPELASRRGDRLAHGYLQRRHDHFRRLFAQIAGLHTLYAVASGGLFAIGGWLVVRGQLTLGQLIAAELVVGTILGTFAKFGKQLDALYDLLAALDKLGHLVDLPLERAGGELPVRSPRPAAASLDGVTCDLAGRPVLVDVALRVAAGERVALTGRSGSGKSLVLHLLAGVRTPASGVVGWDGIDMRDLRLDALRRDVALVGGAEVVSGTVHDNVAMGRPGIGAIDVRHALVSARLLDDVTRLADGLRTPLLPSGLPLGRSQIARLMLARALVTRPRLLLIDGALDDLEPHLLDGVLATLLDDDRRLTMVIVTRRPEILARVDRVVGLPERSLPLEVYS